MPAPKAANGDTLALGSWNILDAQAFTVGKGTKVHKPKTFPTSATVIGSCGVMGRTAGDEDSAREASWADSLVTCLTCQER